MKTILAVCIAALGLSAATVEPLKVTLAAPIVAGGVEFIPGQITVQPMFEGQVMVIRSNSGENSNVMVNRLTGMRHDTGVVLSLRDGRYELEQVWITPEEGFQVMHGVE